VPRAQSSACFFAFFTNLVCPFDTHDGIIFTKFYQYTMSDRLPKLDSHVIDFFLDMAQKMEEELDDETYASVKDIFAKDVSVFEESKKISA